MRRSGRGRLEVEPQCLQDARVHIVGANEDGQFDDLAVLEMALDLGEHQVGHFDVAGHVVGMGSAARSRALNKEVARQSASASHSSSVMPSASANEGTC